MYGYNQLPTMCKMFCVCLDNENKSFFMKYRFISVSSISCLIMGNILKICIRRINTYLELFFCSYSIFSVNRKRVLLVKIIYFFKNASLRFLHREHKQPDSKPRSNEGSVVQNKEKHPGIFPPSSKLAAAMETKRKHSTKRLLPTCSP